ncbi:MAG: SPASM domain-containing protein [Halanaerobiales bacterium]|nr:SPASM domain-containing protein [Halanaerobiales bacterium]
MEGNMLCEEFLNSFYITSNGNVIPCAKFRKAIDNIYNNSLSHIWNTSERWHCIQKYSWADAKDCKGCIDKPYCVRCGAMSFIEGLDSLDNCNETCKLAKIRHLKYCVGDESNE